MKIPTRPGIFTILPPLVTMMHGIRRAAIMEKFFEPRPLKAVGEHVDDET